MVDDSKIYYKHHYWEPPIWLYLFLGGLGGGILFIAWVLSAFVFPGAELSAALLCPVIVALVCIALGLVFLVVDLGQPPVFYRAYVTKTSIIKWGAVLLTIGAFGSLFWILAYVPWGWIRPLGDLFVPIAPGCLGAAGVSGLGIMIYTGVMLSTLKAHSFWATPALPVLFTVSALSTGCAAIMLSVCFWPLWIGPTDPDFMFYSLVAGEAIHELLHLVDMILGIAELIIVLIMILSFLGAGNRTAKRAALRWIKGEYAIWFWGGLIACGLVIPFILNMSGSPLASTVACVLVLIGGCILRMLCVNSDDRQPLPGENLYYKRIQTEDKRVFQNPTWETGASVTK